MAEIAALDCRRCARTIEPDADEQYSGTRVADLVIEVLGV